MECVTNLKKLKMYSLHISPIRTYLHIFGNLRIFTLKSHNFLIKYSANERRTEDRVKPNVKRHINM